MRNAIANILIALTIALLPVYNRISSVDMNRTSKDNLFLILCGLFAVVFSKQVREFPIKGWIALAVALFLMIFNQSNVASVNVMMYSFYACAGMFFLVRFYECFEHEYLDMILNAMCIGALIQAFFILLNGFGHSPEIWIMGIFNDDLKVNGNIFNKFGASPGTLGNPNLSGGYLALCSLAFFRKKWVHLLPVSLAALAATGSAMGMASLMAGGIYFFNVVPKKVAYLSAISAMFLVYFTGLNGADSGRFEIWQMMFSKISSSDYFFGNGLGWFQDLKLKWGDNFVAQEHSGFLTLFNTFGIVGSLYFLYFLWKYINKTGDNKLFSAILFTAFCNAYGHFSIQQSTMMIIILVTVAVCAVKEEQ